MRRSRPELLGLLALTGVLNLWALSRNGWANDYYSGAVRSMSTSWHDFLFASLDHSGVMTVDKPPLALWVQALSVRVFGYHPLAILIPEALMGMASVALLYDLVARRFGRVGGAIAGLGLAVTPITVAISRHNNPDALLVLCSVAAVWCAVRALESARSGRGTRWLVAAGVCVGLGFETKMLVALVVVPGIVMAWLFLAPAARGRLHALGQLLAGGLAMGIVGGAWPALVELTPAAQRPWISGTSDNRVWSLIFEYNGIGRVDGQKGGPGALGGTMFGGSAGPLRLLNSSLGGQGGWLLGFALLSGLGILFASRLRRRDERTGWLMVIGGAFLTTAVLFSFAGGIFHPYYVSLLAPFTAALLGAGAAQLIAGEVNLRIFGPLSIAAGVVCEVIVLGDYPGQLEVARSAPDHRRGPRLPDPPPSGRQEGSRRRAGHGPGGPARRADGLGLRHAGAPREQHLPRRRPRVAAVGPGSFRGAPRRRQGPLLTAPRCGGPRPRSAASGCTRRRRGIPPRRR